MRQVNLKSLKVCEDKKERVGVGEKRTKKKKKKKLKRRTDRRGGELRDHENVKR